MGNRVLEGMVLAVLLLPSFSQAQPQPSSPLANPAEPLLLSAPGSDTPRPLGSGEGDFLPVATERPGLEEPPTATKHPTSAGIGGGMAGLFGGGGNSSPRGYRGLWQPSQSVRGQPADLGLWEQSLSLMAPVWRSGPGMLLVSGSVQARVFQTDAILPDSGRAFPDELWSLRLGTNYIHRLDNGWVAGAGVTVGSASDRPFNQFRDINASVMAFLRMPQEGNNAWNLFLFYAPLSEIPFPIPMASYQWQPSDRFRMNIGLPFQVMYRPYDDLTLNVSYMLLRTVHAQATYRLSDSLQAYAAYDWGNQSWFLFDRTDDRERLFSYEQRLSVGVRTTVLKRLALDLSAGYLFGRFYFTGQDYADNQQNRVDIGNGLFAGLQGGVKW